MHERLREPGHARGQGCRTAALLGGLVLALTVPGTGLKAQVLDTSKAALLSWSDPTEEQIVVGSDSLTGPVWTPWPEPIVKRLGRMCMTVPSTASQQYFKTVPGRQFADCFSDCSGPFTNRNSYMEWFKDPGEECVVTNGFLHVKCCHGGLMLLPPLGTDVQARHRDFCISVDVVDWVTSSTDYSGIYLFARANTDTGIYYSGALALNLGGPGKVYPAIMYPYPSRTTIRGSTNDVQLPYRLQFSGVGRTLTLRVLNPTNGQLIEELSMTNAPLAIGLAAVYVEGQFEAGDSFTLKLDNFFASGTKP